MKDSNQITPQKSRDHAIESFVQYNADYYKKQFNKLDESTRFVSSFNFMAAIFGPMWWGARHLWSYFQVFLLLESIAVVQICRGVFADLGFEEFARSERLSKSSILRRQEANDAIANGADHAGSLMESAVALETASSKALAQAEEIAAQAPLLIVTGICLLVVLRLIQGILSNKALKSRFQNWRADQTLPKGIVLSQVYLSTAFCILVVSVTAYRFSSSQVPEWLKNVPADPQWRRHTETMVDNGFQWLTESFSGLFGGITWVIRLLLDFLEVVMVGTPWPIIMAVIIFLAIRIEGVRVAIFTAAALSYLGILGFWEKSMLTVALLGSACLVCLVIGIPLGILCQRKARVRSVIWPILDLMQTMPSFVYLIPVIAFFGIGKPPGIIATIVFGMPPVVRLTVLGLQGVPAYIREAAEAFGASKSYVLFRVDLPLAKPSIMTGVNQTILMCLSMVVIASLIGARGLGEDVLDALTYANEGKGILAGVAILFCAMILDRIVQGKNTASASSGKP